MSDFYRSAVSLNEYFILKNLNKEIELVINESIFSIVKTGGVLDIGCGMQPLKKHFIEHGYSYKGLDFIQNSEETVDYVTPIDEPVSIVNNTFEIIICTEVLEHVFNWQVAFDNFAKMSADNGILLITCPMFYPLHEEPYDFWRPTPYAIKRMAAAKGFNVLIEKRLGNGTDLLCTLLSNAYFYPENDRFSSRLQTRIANYLRDIVLRKGKKQQQKVLMESPFFMSNLFLLQKKSSVDK